MKNKKWFVWIFVVMLLATVLVPAGVALADVGNFNDYSGGDFDWGGGSDWSGGSDWGDSSSDYGYYGGSDLSGLGYALGCAACSGGGGGGIAFIVIAIIVIFAIINMRRNMRGGGSRMQGPVKPADFTDQITQAITPVDPQFSPGKFVAFAKEVFITLQQAWTERDWKKIRPFEKEELYQQHNQQLDEYIRLGRINVIERINVNEAYLHKYYRDAQFEYLTVYMDTRMGDYIIDEKTKAVIKGDPSQEYHMRYLLTFMRKTGVQTNEKNGDRHAINCPNCGAPLSITSAGQCDYCGSIVTTGDFGWVLSDMVNVKPGVQVDNTGVTIRDGGQAGQANAQQMQQQQQAQQMQQQQQMHEQAGQQAQASAAQQEQQQQQQDISKPGGDGTPPDGTQ